MNATNLIAIARLCLSFFSQLNTSPRSNVLDSLYRPHLRMQQLMRVNWFRNSDERIFLYNWLEINAIDFQLCAVL